MFIGFDYGTANCSVAVMRDQGPELLTLENNEPYLPSMLCAPTREAVSECLHRHWQVPTGSEENQQLLRRAITFNREEDIPVNGDSVLFGLQALAHYIEDPEEVYFVRSPKSFLGANGLKPQQIALFEDLVCAMMFHIKRQAESVLQTSIDQAVIGRPINFQGTGGEEANQQAQGILHRAAQRAGFKEIEFQFEPVAAGLDFEATLSEEKTVLVVDIGGGTTDCSVLLMGPQWRDRADRQQSLLGHSGCRVGGCRVGGNDLDIMLAFKQLMPLFGMGGETEKGIAMPALPYWNAVATNDVPAQIDFYSTANGRMLRDLIRDAAEPEKVKRLLKVHQQRLSYRLVRAAEESKIALSGQASISAQLDFVQPELAETISQEQLADAIAQPLLRIQEQVSAALATSQSKPQVIYLTGGSARSPLLRTALQQQLPGIPIVGGNDFGSVTAGLARWAQTLFR
ncbi:molecular chaperone [Serratia fonticola]